MKPTGGTSTRIRMSCRSADHGSSLSLAWRDWPTPIDRGCNSSMPTCRIDKRRKLDSVLDAGVPLFRRSLRGASSLLLLVPEDRIPVVAIGLGHRLLALAAMI